MKEYVWEKSVDLDERKEDTDEAENVETNLL